MTIYIVLCLVPIIFAGIAAVIIVSRRIDSQDAGRLSTPTPTQRAESATEQQAQYTETPKVYSQTNNKSR